MSRFIPHKVNNYTADITHLLPCRYGREADEKQGGIMKNNKKGYGLVELLLVMAVIAISMPLLFLIYTYGIQAFSTGNRQVEQHYKIIDVTQRIRKDIEEAAAIKVYFDASDEGKPEASELTVWIPDDDEATLDYYMVNRWRLEDGQLYLKSCQGTYPASDNFLAAEDGLDAIAFTPILDGLDTGAVQWENGTWHMPTRFDKSLNGDVIILSVKPVETNEFAFRNKNVTNPIITEFSVLYKKIIN